MLSAAGGALISALFAELLFSALTTILSCWKRVLGSAGGWDV